VRRRWYPKGGPETSPSQATLSIKRLGIILPLGRGKEKSDTLQERHTTALGKLLTLRRLWMNFSWSMEAILTAITTILVPTLAYGCELWETDMIKGMAEKLWYGMVKRTLGWHGNIQRKALYLALGLPSMEAYRLHLRTRAILRMLRNPNHPAHLSPTTHVTDEMRAEWLERGWQVEKTVKPTKAKWKAHSEASTDRAKALGIGTEKGRSWQEWALHLAESADIGENRRTVFTDGSVLDDGRAGAGWAYFKGGTVHAPLGRGLTSGDAEARACINAIAQKDGPWLIPTDSTTALHLLAGDPDEVPTYVAEARADSRDITIGWIKGHAEIADNERADAEARMGAEEVPEDSPVSTFSLAWGKKLDTDMWEADKTDPYWGSGRVRKWWKSAARTLLRIRQAAGPCVLCGHETGNTRHIMVICPEFEKDRIETSLYNPNGPSERRGHPGWECWLSEKQHGDTENFIRRVAAKWKEKGAYPLERSVEPYGDKVARDGLGEEEEE